jgi:hypothetical protein
MSTDRETTRLVRSWLEEGVTALPDRVLDAVLDQLPATPQRRHGSAWRVRSMSNPVRIALAAAAAVVVALVGFRLLGPPIGPGSPTLDPTVSAPAPTPLAIPAQGELVPGSYVLTTVAPLRITFTVPAAGWQKNVAPNAIWTGNSEGRVGFGTVDNLYADPCATVLTQRDPPVGPSVDDLASALANLPGLDSGTVVDATFAGRPAKLVEIVATIEQVDCGLDGYALWDEVPFDEGRNRVFVLDVDGTRLAVHAVERPALTQVLRNELQQILDSVRIE